MCVCVCVSVCFNPFLSFDPTWSLKICKLIWLFTLSSWHCLERKLHIRRLFSPGKITRKISRCWMIHSVHSHNHRHRNTSLRLHLHRHCHNHRHIHQPTTPSSFPSSLSHTQTQTPAYDSIFNVIVQLHLHRHCHSHTGHQHTTPSSSSL